MNLDEKIELQTQNLESMTTKFINIINDRVFKQLDPLTRHLTQICVQSHSFDKLAEAVFVQ